MNAKFEYEMIKFPAPSLADEQGVLVIGGDLEPERLLAAYSRSLCPLVSHAQESPGVAKKLLQ
jgi:leucyl/phenylalanyl-tRNA--protein transferase